ncbi:MAG TPA: ATP-dependent DNA helicase PcrA [bacterium]|nr:ATP-dependent DNA helicase PcrA [bacterium]
MNLSKLNPQQLGAVKHTEGPLLILAGAGSGKTSVLTHRIAYLLDQKLAAPEQILAVTFTNKAAGEMKERVAKLANRKGSLVRWIGTFHSVCVRILKTEGHLIGLDQKFTIYDKTDQLSAVKEAMDKLLISKKDFNPNAVLSYISSAKNELVTSEEYPALAQGYFQTTVAKIYPEYQKVLKENNALDFDDLIMKTVQLLQKEKDVLKKYQNLFKYVLVDEYQDTNHAQYLFVLLLAKAHQNLAVVGDDDQSIYKFRGATIKNILNFEKDFPGAKVIKLEQNYRSTQKILDASYGVISQNKKRADKKLWTENDKGESIILFQGMDEKVEAGWVTDRIEELLNSGDKAENITILYRTNAQSRAMEEALLKAGQPYRIIGNVRFYERKEVKDIISYLRTIYNPKDDLSLKRIINVPRRGIGAKSVNQLEEVASSNSHSLVEEILGLEINDQTDWEELKGSKSSSTPPALSKFRNLIIEINAEAAKLVPSELIKFILDKSGYLESLDDGTPENEARTENVYELISVATKYDPGSSPGQNPEEGLANFMEEIALVEQETETEGESGVTLMTVHAAKGLEFDHVFVIGMEEGLFPHSRSYSDVTEMEEERRLAYVAITRAKQNLYLTHTDSRLYFGSRQSNLLSRFVEDIPKELLVKEGGDAAPGSTSGWEDVEEEEFRSQIELDKGDKVLHPTFGKGEVLYIDDSIIKIAFGGGVGVKELAIEYAVLEKI